jgi:hypothetical protein
MTDPRRIPLVPLVLGLAGLVPFWVLALGLRLPGPAMPPPELRALALAAYAAVIISFLGGIRWGLSMRDGDSGAGYVLSNVPPLVAWALVLVPDPWRLAALGAVLLALGPMDLALVRSGAAPVWFGRLRLLLSTGAGVALLSAAVVVR